MLSSRPVDFNNGGVFFPTKTPARGIRRLENQTVGGPMMSAKGGKMPGGMPKTPFHAGSSQKTILYTISRPLGDKTPAPNRLNVLSFKTPAGGKTGGKMSKLVLETDNGNANDQQDGNTPPSSQRPSSLRKHIKQPKQLNLMGKLDVFQTPLNKGHHWDIEDDDVVGMQDQGLMQEAILEDAVEEDNSSDGEVEFGHPNNLDLPYQPPFDFELPDFRVLGQTVRSLAFAPLICDSEKPVFSDPQMLDSDLSWKGLEIQLAPLQSDDPFEEARNEGKLPITSKPTVAAGKGRVPLTKAASVKPTTSTTATRLRPTSSLARLPSQPNTRSQVTRAASSNRLASSSAATTTTKADSTKAAVTGATTMRKVVGKPAIPSTASTRAIARSTSATSAGSAQPVVRQNLTSLRRAQTAMSVVDSKVGIVNRTAPAIKSRVGVTKLTRAGAAKAVESQGHDFGMIKMNVGGDEMDEEFMFNLN